MASSSLVQRRCSGAATSTSCASTSQHIDRNLCGRPSGLVSSVPCGNQRRQSSTACRIFGLGGADNPTARSLTERLARVRQQLGIPQYPASTPAAPGPSSSNGPATSSTGNGNNGAGAAGTGGPGESQLGVGEWGAQSWYEDWDPSARYTQAQVEQMANDGIPQFRKKGGWDNNSMRDKWITPLLDWDAVKEGLDFDQERSEQILTGEALANKEESQTAVRYLGRLIGIPLVIGFVVSRALANPILNYNLKNNPDAFALSDLQKVEGAQAVHVEEARLRMDMAIGRAPPMGERQIFEHLAEFASEVQEEERHHNETILINAVSDSITSLALFGIFSQRSRGRDALFNTLSRLFYGLSDIAKAVGIILVADTLLGYHSEEGWHGLIELVLGHYGIEPSEEGVVIFVGTVPVIIDVFFKYWIFIGLNRISPGAVVTIKQVDRH